MSVLLLITAPKDRVEIPIPVDKDLSNLRKNIQNYLKEFVFVDLNNEPISRFYQPTTPVNLSQHITLRYTTKQNTTKTQSVIRQQIGVNDVKLNFKNLIKVGLKQSLSEARRHIAIPSGYQNFNFLNKNKLEISQTSQNNYLVENILTSQKDKNMYITLRKSSVKNGSYSKNGPSSSSTSSSRNGLSLAQFQETEGVKDKTQKTLATKAKVQDMIKQLDQFEKNISTDVKEKNQQKQKKLQQISKRLDQMNVAYSFKSSTDIGTVIAELKTVTKQSQKLIELLGAVNSYTINQLASKAPELVGVGYYQGQITRQNPIDFALTQFEEDLSCNNLVSVDFQYKSQKAQMDHLATIQTKLNGGSSSVMGGTPFFFVRTGASYDESNQFTQSQKNSQRLTSFFKNFYALFTGTGLRLTEDNLELKQIVISKFQSLYVSKRNTADQKKSFEEQALQFLSKYGDQVQIGSFYFGNTFSTSLKVEFQQQQSYYQSKKIAQTAMAMAVEGGGIFQGGFGAAKAAYDDSTTSASSSQNEKLSSKYATSAHQTSYPPVQNFGQWKEVVAVKNNYWKILGKNTKLVSLFKLLQSPNTISRSVLLKNQPIEKIKSFLNELQIVNDTKIQTEQYNTRQFVGIDFFEAVNKMNILNNPAKIQNIIVKRTSGNHQVKQVQVHLHLNRRKNDLKQSAIQCKYGYNSVVMMVLSRSNSLLKKKQQLYYQSVKIKLLRIQALEIGLRRFNILKTLTIYGRFYLYSSSGIVSIAQRLNTRNLTEQVIIDPEYKNSSDTKKQLEHQNSWTTYLTGAKVTYSAWK